MLDYPTKKATEAVAIVSPIASPSYSVFGGTALRGGPTAADLFHNLGVQGDQNGTAASENCGVGLLQLSQL